MSVLSLPTGPHTACVLRDVAKGIKHSPAAAAVAMRQGFLVRLAAFVAPGAPAVDKKLRLWALRTMWCLSKHVDAPYLSVAQPKILECVLAALSDGAMDEEAYACLDAVRACIDTDTGVGEFVVAGGIGVLRSVLMRTSCPPPVIWRALDCLVGLQNRRDYVPFLLLVIRAVYAAMAAHTGSVLVQLKAMQLLAALANDDTAALVATQTAMDTVTAARVAMDKHDSKSIQQYGCVVLGRLPGLLHVAVAARVVIRAMNLAPASCVTVRYGCTALYKVAKSAPGARKLMQLLCIKLVRGVLARHHTCFAVQPRGNKLLAYLCDGPLDVPVDLDSDTDTASASSWDESDAEAPAPSKRVRRH